MKPGFLAYFFIGRILPFTLASLIFSFSNFVSKRISFPLWHSYANDRRNNNFSFSTEGWNLPVTTHEG